MLKKGKKPSKKSKSKKHKHGFFKFVTLILAALGVWTFFKLPKDKRKKVIRGSEKQASRLVHKLHDFFIPHERNEYKPHVFQRHSVKHLILLIIVVKVGVVSSLFALYPNLGKLDADIQSAMYRLINEYRVEQSQTKLTTNSYLENVALQKGRDMLDKNYFSHYGIDGREPWEWIDTAFYDFKSMGENLAMDFLTANSVFTAFQKSPAHDRNLVSASYSEIGIAILNGYLDGHNTNVMVVFFGSPKPAVAATAVAVAEPDEEVIIPEPDVVAEVVVEEIIPEPVESEPVIEPVADPVESEPEPEEDVTSRLAVRPVDNEDTAVLGQAIAADDRIVSNFTGGISFSQGSMVQRIIAWSDRFFLGLLIALVLLLLINTIVKFRVQHKSVFVNAAVLIIIATVALNTKIHHVEAIGEQVRVLGSFF